MLTNDLVDALAIEYRFVQRLRSHQQLAHVVGVVDPLVPRLTLARSGRSAIVEGRRPALVDPRDTLRAGTYTACMLRGRLTSFLYSEGWRDVDQNEIRFSCF